MISCKQIATLAQSAREAIAAGEKWMRIEEDCLAILELANLATIGLVTKQQAEHAGVEPPHCYAFKTCSSPAICAKAGHCVNTFDAQQQAEPVGDDEGEAFSAAMKIARDLGNHASYAYVWNAALQQAAQQQAEPNKFSISKEWLGERLERADDADCAIGQSKPERPCDAPPGCNAANCLGCGEQQAEPSEGSTVLPVLGVDRAATKQLLALGWVWVDGKWSAPQSEPVGDEQALFEAAITKLSETTTFEKVYEDTELNSFWALWKEARAAQSGQRAGITDDMRAAVRFAPSSAHWSQKLVEFFGPDAREGINALEKQLRDALAGQRAGVAEGCDHDWGFHLESADGKDAIFTCHKCGAERRTKEGK